MLSRRVTFTAVTVTALLFAGVAAADVPGLLGREIVVYTRNVAEVTETRQVTLSRGEGELLLPGVPSGVFRGSIHVDVIDGGAATTRALAFSDQLLDIDAYWRNRVGERVTITVDDTTELSGTLARATDRALYLTMADEPGVLHRIERSRVDHGELSDVPRSLVLQPSVRWMYDARRGGEATVRLSYLTGGLRWHGEHRVALEGTRAGVVANGVVANETGITFPFDRLTVVGGAIHLAGDRRRVDRLNPKPGAMSGGDDSRFGDVRRWVVDGGELVANHSTSLELVAENVRGVEREYIYDATIFDDRISAHVKFSLAGALPGGDVRVFEIHGGDALFVGEDRVDDTPPGSEVDLNVGQVFDLTAERTRISEGTAADGRTKQRIEVELGNSGGDDVTVRVLERMFGDWSIPFAERDGSPIEHEKEDARTAAFDVLVPAGETVTVTYDIVYER
ncbi:MAG: hypothetical protein MAG453_01852 [Calditrichaeota bacterium]|nr:hypothetical protein [Calditrichota bacterium]